VATKTSVRPAALAQNQRERDPVTKKKTKKKGTPKKNSVNGQFRARIDAKSGPSRWKKKFFFVAEKFRCTVVYFFFGNVHSNRLWQGRDSGAMGNGGSVFTREFVLVAGGRRRAL